MPISLLRATSGPLIGRLTAGARSGKCALSVRDRGTNTGKLYEHARKNVKEITELSVVFVCYQQEIAKRRKGMKGS